MLSRQSRLRQLLLEHSPELEDRFRAIVDGSDIVSRTALLWRSEVETCVTQVRRSPRAIVMTYEQLASDAITHAKAMFDQLGVAFGEPTVRFIESLHEIRADGRGNPRRTGWGDKYFSVMRNPREQKDSWKQKISAEDRGKIESIMKDSPAIEYCATLGEWA